MAFTVTKFTELNLINSLPLSSPTHSLRILNTFCSLRTTHYSNNPRRQNPKPRHPSPSSSSPSPWISKWPNPPEVSPDRRLADPTPPAPTDRVVVKDPGRSAIERIVLRLRNLGLGSDDEQDDTEEGDLGLEPVETIPITGEEKLGDLLQRQWVRPDIALDIENDGNDETMLPWEREEERKSNRDIEEGKGLKKRRVLAPTRAELTLDDGELRRLRRLGMVLRDRTTIPKAGVTQLVLQKIHDKWRKEELVRLKFHEDLAHDMKTAHKLVERRTGGLIIWQSGSVMVVYRGTNYEGPSRTQPVDSEQGARFIPGVSSMENPPTSSDDTTTSTSEKSEQAVKIQYTLPKKMTEEEIEFNKLLDELGPRFVDWWGTGILPVDADLLPQKIPGYKTPPRLRLSGTRSRLTNNEMTNLRKLTKKLPCHFALGRNRHHQGLASAIIKLWETSLVVKIAVKQGIQNTNNKLMAEEIRDLTGGIIMLRNKFFIIIYRGKDFLPTTVAAALSDREQMTKEVQDLEEKVRIQDIQNKIPNGNVEHVLSGGLALVGTLAEFYEAQDRWGREVTPEEREKMVKEAAEAKQARLVRQIAHKIAVAQAKKLKAEKLLSKIEASMIPSGPDYDQETITDEERAMFRRVGLRMKAYLPLGIRGVFDGVIENMHLHWKHRELVKLISKQKTLAFVEESARLLEFESGGILVAIESVPKGFALIYYRGKNYRRPLSLRPRNLLTKAKALKRSLAMQRHEALSQHISELEKNIDQMTNQVGVSKLEKYAESRSVDNIKNDSLDIDDDDSLEIDDNDSLENEDSEDDDSYFDFDDNDSNDEKDWKDDDK